MDRFTCEDRSAGAAIGLLKQFALNILGIQVCANCQSMKADFKHCGKCKIVRYCSRECQAKNWSSHKQVCASCD